MKERLFVAEAKRKDISRSTNKKKRNDNKSYNVKEQK